MLSPKLEFIVGLIGTACIAGMALLLLIVHAAIVRLALRMFEYTPPLNADLSAADDRAERFEILTGDNIRLSACLFRPAAQPPRGLVVFSHELGADKWSAMSYCEALYRAGFNVLAFDFRSHGESDGVPGYSPIHWLTTGEVQDLQSVLSYVDSRPDLRDLPLGLFGISRGAGTSLVVAAQSPRVRCVCSDSAYTTRSMTRLYARRWMTLFVPAWAAERIPSWHIDMTITVAWWISQLKRHCRYVAIESYLPQLSGLPVSLISGKRDTYVHPDIAKSVFERIGGDQSTLWIVPGAKHNQARNVATAEYDERLVKFFDQACKPAVESPDVAQPALEEVRDVL